jgi:cyanophycinase
MGKVILIGGHVDIGASLTQDEKKEFRPVKTIKMVKAEIFHRMVKEANGKDSCYEIITSASHIPLKVGREYKKALERLGCKNVGVMHIKSAKEADQKNNLERLNRSDCILFTGGNQSLLSRRFHNSKFLRRLKLRFKKEKDFLISGTSAGAMILSKVTIDKDQSSTPFVKGHVNIIHGFNLLSGIIIDTHFIQRRRLARLIEAVAAYPDKLGVGLSEDTAVFFSSPNKVEVIGSNVVVLIDGSEITYTNLKQIKPKHNICLQDVKLHVLPKGKTFSIAERRIF